MTYTKLNNDLQLLRMKIKVDEIQESGFKTEQHDYENFSKSLKIDINSYQKKYKPFKKNKILLNITEFLIGSTSKISSSIEAILNPSAGIILSRPIAR